MSDHPIYEHLKDEPVFKLSSPLERTLARKAWDYQQKKLDTFNNTGMIGASPAQFLKKIINLEREIEELKIVIMELNEDLDNCQMELDETT